uniref:hypothetical protein n=1 Tax=Nocardia suismassiliense TaxID=2077092 RepID=UPI003F49481E
MMFVVAARPGLIISDDLNRADGPLGPMYTALGTAPVIASNRAQAASPGANQTVVYAARHNTVLTSDDQEIAFTIANATVNPAPGLGGGAFLRSTTAGARVEALITNTQAIIATRIGGTQLNRATASISSPVSARLTAVGNLYSLHINGGTSAVASWPDTGGAIAIGATTRSIGIVTIGQADFTGTVSRGYAIDGYIARDL